MLSGEEELINKSVTLILHRSFDYINFFYLVFILLTDFKPTEDLKAWYNKQPHTFRLDLVVVILPHLFILSFFVYVCVHVYIHICI